MKTPINPAACAGTGQAAEIIAAGQTQDDRAPAVAASPLVPEIPALPAEPDMKPLSRHQKWSKANPVKRWAHMALRSAVRRGLVTQKACEDCGREKSEAHHTDYSRPMHVLWLCRACHMAAHKRLKGAAIDDNASL